MSRVRLLPPSVSIPMIRELISSPNTAGVALRQLKAVAWQCILRCLQTTVDHSVDQEKMIPYVWDLFDVYQKLVRLTLIVFLLDLKKLNQ